MRLALMIAAIALLGCAQVREAPPAPDAARPPVLGSLGNDGPVRSRADWTRRASALRDLLQREEYGRMPPPAAVTAEARQVIDNAAFGGLGRIEAATLTTAAPATRFGVTVAMPNSARPHPVIILISFCGARAEFQGRADIPEPLTPTSAFCHRDPPAPAAEDADDPYLRGPPIETILRRGYALAIVFAGDVVPDDPATAPAALERLSPGAPAGERLGAIAAWAWTVSRVVDFLDADPRFDHAHIAVLGHSRNGKAAVVAAAFDPRIAALIAHQSGTGGATLSRHEVGERVRNITGAFPYWFAPNFARYTDNEAALPFDQHDVLALVAPRAILLGNGVDDSWTDPAGAFRSAQGASPVWRLYGRRGLVQPSIAANDNSGDIAAFLRPGRHGIRQSDWAHFLAFLDARFRDRRR